jgi:hypothetical protein
MQKLYEAGLSDIYMPDMNRQTLLMCITKVLLLGLFLDRARWLILKDVNPNQLLPGIAAPIVHKIIRTSMVLIQGLTFIALRSDALVYGYLDCIYKLRKIKHF